MFALSRHDRKRRKETRELIEVPVPTWTSIPPYLLFSRGFLLPPLSSCFTLLSASSITSTSIPFLTSLDLVEPHVQGGGLHTWSSVGESVYLPYVRISMRNTVSCSSDYSSIKALTLDRWYYTDRSEWSKSRLICASGLSDRGLSSQLHFSKPTAYDEIYNSQNKWDKDYEFYRAFDMDESSFTQTSYSISKKRRAVISNMFSKRSISEIQHLIRSHVWSITSLHISLPNWLGSWIDFVMRLESRTQLVSNFTTFPSH
jgi:hypothetical protein